MLKFVSVVINQISIFLISSFLSIGFFIDSFLHSHILNSLFHFLLLFDCVFINFLKGFKRLLLRDLYDMHKGYLEYTFCASSTMRYSRPAVDFYRLGDSKKMIAHSKRGTNNCPVE